MVRETNHVSLKSMKITDSTILEFNEYHFVVKNISPMGTMDESLFHYFSHPLIRDAVRKVVNILVTDYRTLCENALTVGTAPGSAEKDSMEGRRNELGRLITALEYVTLQNNLLTIVAGEGQFISEQISSAYLRSLFSHVKSLLGVLDPGREMVQQVSAAPVFLMPSLGLELFTCRRCGKCCGSYTVVVKPDDCGRLAAFLTITGTEFSERYLEKEPFTWSEHNRQLRRMPSKGRKGREQQLMCVFLKKEAENASACIVHKVRPDACRRYIPGTSLCLLP
jgi:Fe-S-cluster containining protein